MAHRYFAPSILACLTCVLACGGGGDGGGGGPPTSELQIQAGSPSGTGQSGTVGTALPAPLRVRITEGGAPLAGRTPAWSTTSGSITGTGPSDSDGIAEADWTLGSAAGAAQASATLSGASGSPVSFAATALAGPASALQAVSGAGQAVIAGAVLSQPVVARVSDGFGNAVGGVEVSWSVPTGDATAAPPSAMSGANGQVQATVQTGGATGPIVVRAVATAVAPVDFAAEAGSVVVLNDTFMPANITVPAGTTVRWVWPVGSGPHNVTPDAAAPARSGNPATGLLGYEFTFPTPGTYDYHCEVHGASGGFGMSGTVTVTP